MEDNSCQNLYSMCRGRLNTFVSNKEEYMLEHNIVHYICNVHYYSDYII